MKIVNILPGTNKQETATVFQIYTDYIDIERRVVLDADLPTPSKY